MPPVLVACTLFLLVTIVIVRAPKENQAYLALLLSAILVMTPVRQIWMNNLSVDVDVDSTWKFICLSTVP